MSKAAGSNGPKVEDLIAARNAAMACINAAKDYWQSVVKIPDLDPLALVAKPDPRVDHRGVPELARFTTAALINTNSVKKRENELGPKLACVIAVVNAFDDLPEDILAAVDRGTRRDDSDLTVASAHRAARNLADELRDAGGPIDIPSHLPPGAWHAYVALTTWQRVRRILPPDEQASRRWNELADQIRVEHARLVALAIPQCVAGEEAPAKKPRSTWLAEAMLRVRDKPWLSDRAIAKKVSKNPSTLSRSPEYKVASGLARRQPPKGFVKNSPKGEPTDVDAYSSDDDPATKPPQQNSWASSGSGKRPRA